MELYLIYKWCSGRRRATGRRDRTDPGCRRPRLSVRGEVAVASEIGLPTGSLVVSDVEESLVATGETELRAGETYLVAARPGVAEEVVQLFRG